MSVPISREKAVFDAALEVTDPGQRKLFLDQACVGDAELRAGVEELLATQGDAEQFFAESASSLTTLASELESAVAQTEERSELAAEEKPGTVIGRYKLLQKIGEGGGGVVYMAEQEQPVRRRVALKVIKLGMDTKNVIARFEVERQALAMMDHSNIARVLDAGATETGRPYFVMELVNGVKVTEYCDQNQLGLEQRLELFIQICHAIQHAHQKGIIHRDIKPSNILVTLHDGVPVPKVIDFGIVKATGEQLTDKTLFTAYSQLIGTPAYMSPEQMNLNGLDLDTRSDIYSLGVLLYELLTGKTPFDTKELLKSGVDEMRRTLREREPGTPSSKLRTLNGEELTKTAMQRHVEPPQLLSQLRGDLDWITMKALEKDRTRRYETANGLAMDVKRFLENEPILARPPSRFYKFQKMVRRNRFLFIGIGVIAILLVVSLILVSASLAKERQSRLEAKHVKQFLEETLQGVEPEVARGRDTTILREILDKAAARIDNETNQPAVAAELRSVIGAVYERTAQYRQAEEMQRAALAICRERFGRESPEAAAALNELGITLIASGKKLEAEQVNREALEIRRRRFGNENAEVATSEDNLAHACNDNGKFTEAEALIRDALATRRKLFGEESQEVMESLRNQVLILGSTGKWAEAEATAHEVLTLRRKLFGPQDPSVAWALNDLSWATAGNGKQNEAEAIEREALALRQKVLSDNNPDVAESLYHLGDRMRQHGNLEDAYSVLSAALSLFRKSLGDDHPSTLYTLSNLGLVCEAETNWSESEIVFRQVLASWRKQAGGDDPQTLYTMRNLAGALEGQGKWAEAETLHREAFASWRKRAGNEDPETIWEVGQLTRNLEMQKKFGEAEQLLDEALTPVFVKEPASAGVLAARVDFMGHQGRWQEAAADAALILKYQPADHYRYHILAGILAITRNRADYEQLCQRILPMFTNTSNPYIAERVADDCLLLPNSGADLKQVDRLANMAVICAADEPYFQACKALSEYRQGQFPEAVVWAGKSLKTSQVFAHAKGCAVLAMAQWQLGQKDVARATLAEGNTLAPDISHTNGTVDLGDSWLAWLFARITLDEAGQLIQPDTIIDGK